MNSNHRGRLIGLLPLVVLLACGDSESPSGPGPDPDPGPNPGPAAVASVSVDAGTGEVIVGGSLPLTAVVRDANGTALTGRTVTWSSLETGVASVSASGTVTGVAPGSATITAMSEGKSGSATVRVLPPPVARVAVAPDSARLTVGARTTLTAATFDTGGAALTGRPISWSSGDPAVATVDDAGVATGVAPGTTTITASSEGQTGSAVIVVTAVPVASVQVEPSSGTLLVGEAGQLVAHVRDASGTNLTGRTVRWTSSNTRVASVNGGGVVHGVAVGTAVITAESEGVRGTATVTVKEARYPVGSVVVRLAGSPSLFIGETRNLSVEVRDSRGVLVTDRAVTWGLSRTDVVVSITSGSVAQVHGLDLGAVTVTARAEGVTDGVRLHVSGPLNCTTIRGSGLFAQDGQFLGNVSNQYLAESIFNEFGIYGSPYSATSIFNPYGTYGSIVGSYSAYNIVALYPPLLRKHGLDVAFVTKNVVQFPLVDPDALRGCAY